MTKCKYCKEKIRKKEAYEIVWKYMLGLDGPSWYSSIKVHPWCAKLGIKEGRFLKENPIYIENQERIKKIKNAKIEWENQK